MKKFSIEFKWGIIYTLVFIIWMAFEKAIGLHDVHVDRQLVFTNLFMLITIPVYTFAIRDKKRHYYHGNVNWTQAFLSGTIVSIIAAALNPLALNIVFNYISPDFFKNISNYYIAHNKITADKAPAYFSLKSYIIQNTSSGISTGVLLSAIVALFVRTKTETK